MTESDPSAFVCEVHREDDGIVVVASGEIDLASSPELRSLLHDLLDDDAEVLVLDLQGVSFIDSSGLGVLVGVLQRAQEQPGRRFELRGVQGPVRRVFDITGLDEVFALGG